MNRDPGLRQRLAVEMRLASRALDCADAFLRYVEESEPSVVQRYGAEAAERVDNWSHRVRQLEGMLLQLDD